MPGTSRAVLLLLVASVAMGCGASGMAPPPPPPPVVPPPPPPAPGPLAGTYTTRVTLTQSACGQITVQDSPTVVTHELAGGAITMSHAGQVYSGSVAANGTFATNPKVVDVNDGFLYTITISGQFATNAFDADATVDRTSQGTGTCRFVVHWAATR